MAGSWSIVNLNWSWRTISCCLLTLTQPYGLILAPNLFSFTPAGDYCVHNECTNSSQCTWHHRSHLLVRPGTKFRHFPKYEEANSTFDSSYPKSSSIIAAIIPPSMMLLWASAGVPLGVYNIVEHFNIALRIQAQILTFLSLLTWSQCYHYGRGWSVGKCALILVGMCTLLGGIEAGLIFALRVSPDKQNIPSIRQY